MADDQDNNTLFDLGRNIIYDSMNLEIYSEIVSYLQKEKALRLESTGTIEHCEGYSIVNDVQVGVQSCNSQELSEETRRSLKGLNDIVFGELAMALAFRTGGLAHTPAETDDSSSD